MGIGCSTISDEPTLKHLLELSMVSCEQNTNEKKNNINRLKEELIKYLNLKDLNSSKEKMDKILKEEDDIIVYDILHRILDNLREKINLIISNNECPSELKAHLNTAIYAASCLKIKDLKKFRNIIKDIYGSKYISKDDKNEEKLINELLFEKLKTNNYSEQLIKIKLKLICEENKIDYQFLGIINPEDTNINTSSIRRTKSILDSNMSYVTNKSIIPPKDTNNVQNEYDKQFEELSKNDPFKKLKTVEEKFIDKSVFIKGEQLFLPYDEKIDEKCYALNKIDNWAESFYNLKSGIILEKFKELISKTEFSAFFEGLNYEYGINNCPLDVNKAFEIYKKAAENTTDTLSMYRLYHIYKKDYKKFNMENRSHVLEKFYIMKCFTYLTQPEKENELFKRFAVTLELKALLINEKNEIYNWFFDYLVFLNVNNNYYDISKDDVNLIQSVIYFWFIKKTNSETEHVNELMDNLAEKGNPHAIYNLVTYYKDNKKINSELLKKLYEMNYYRSFIEYTKELPYNEETLAILKKSISNGYIAHIKVYSKIFMNIYEIDDIVKKEELKSEFLNIINCLIDIVIIDEMDVLIDYIYMRNKLIKHYNFEDILKNSSDIYFKEILNYLNKFKDGKDEDNKNKIIKYYISIYYYQLLYTLFGHINYNGIKGILEKNYNETLNIYNYLLKNDDGYFKDQFYYYYIYLIKNKQRRLNEQSNKKDEKEIKELMDLEKKVLNLFYEDLSVDKIKKYPPTFFYYLSKLFRSNTINTKDLILEYVFLNRAVNSKLNELKEVDYQVFEEKYLIAKAKKKLIEKNKDENFKKIKEAKGAINVEGYGEDGIICPICMENRKSVISLPCQHFFCGTCMTKIIGDGTCPICRTQIKITFDINLKKETLIKSRIVPNY